MEVTKKILDFFRSRSLTRSIYVPLLPWTNAAMVDQLKSEYDSSSAERRFEIRHPYIRALVHSKRHHDVEFGKEMLSFVTNMYSLDPKQMRKLVYLNAVAHFRLGEFSKSAECVDKCLEIEPNYRKARRLKIAIDAHLRSEGGFMNDIIDVTGIGVMTTTMSYFLLPAQDNSSVLLPIVIGLSTALLTILSDDFI